MTAAAPAVPLRRQRSFGLVWVACTSDTLGMSAAVVALPLVAVTTLHASTFEVSLLTVAAWSPGLLFGLPAGALVDRVRKRPLMLLCAGGMAVLLLGASALAWAGALTLTQLVVISFCAGCLALIALTAFPAMLPSLVPPEQIGEAVGNIQATAWTARILGPSLAGSAVQALGAVGGALGSGLLSTLSLLCLVGVRVTEKPPVTGDEAFRSAVGTGLRYVFRDPFLRPLALFSAIVAAARAGQQAVQTVFLVREVGLSAGTAGLLLSSVGVGGVLGALAVRRLTRRFGAARGLLLLQLGVTPLTLLIPLATAGLGVAPYIIGSMAVGIGMVGGNVVVTGFRLTYCPPELVGRVTATMMTLVNAAIPLGALVGGVLGSTLGVRAGLLIGSATLLLAVVPLLASPMRTAHELPTRTVPSGPPDR